MAMNKPPKKKTIKKAKNNSQQLAGYNVGDRNPKRTKKTNDMLGAQINKEKRRVALKKQIATNNAIKKITGVSPKPNKSKSQLRAIFAKKK